MRICANAANIRKIIRMCPACVTSFMRKLLNRLLAIIITKVPIVKKRHWRPHTNYLHNALADLINHAELQTEN